MSLQVKNFTKVFGNHTHKKEKKQKGAVKEFIAKLSKGLMLPIAMLPIAGIFLGVGAAIETGAGTNEGLKIFGSFLKIPGDVIFGALPVLFAIAIAIAFTGDAGPAGLAALVGFLVFSGLQQALITPINVDGQLVGYNLLFYTNDIVGTTFNDGGGLPTSLFGTVLGIRQLSSSVFGGFVVGFTVAFLYNKYKNIKLPAVIGFFSGIRFIPIVVFGAFFPITILFLMLWPLFGILLTYIGIGLGQAVGFNSFAFGFIERALVPFGLHHAFYSPLWYTSVGGSVDLSAAAIIEINGSKWALSNDPNASGSLLSWQQLIANLKGLDVKDVQSTVAGDQTMWAFFNTNLLGEKVYLYNIDSSSEGSNGYIISGTLGTLGSNDPHVITWADLTSGQKALGTAGANGFNGVNIGQYLQGKYVFMIFGLPAAAAAMAMAAPKENRKLAISIVASAGFTSFLTGITEPIEFTFLFLAPWLFWGVHAFFCALAFGLMNWIGLIMIATGNGDLAPHIGMSFSGGIIDWIIYGAIQMPFGSNAWWAIVFGLMYLPIYYFLFLILIKKYNIATPGRGENTKLFTKADFLAKKDGALGNISSEEFMALNVVSAYGGFENIKNVDACITKLRIQVDKQDIVDTDKLMSLGAKGTIKPSAQSVYAVFGAEADIIKNNIKGLIGKLEKDPSLKDKWMNAIKDQSSSSETKNSSSNAETNGELANEKIIVKSPVDGKVVLLDKVPDETFSQEMMGKGIAIEPINGKFGSPIDGKMSLVFDTGHAYTFESEKGTQILIHIGIDSINLTNKKGEKVETFESLVKTGDEVKTGQDISNVKLTGLKYAKSKVTPIIVLNESLAGREVKLLRKSGEVKKGTPLFEILPKKN